MSGSERLGGIAVETQAVSFTYPDGTQALDGIDVRIGAGERVVLIGQNGSGKSTLVRHFNGLLRASRGHVLVDGTQVGQRHVAELASQVGIAFQNPDRQIFASRVRQEVAFGARNVGRRGSDLDESVRQALAAVGLLERVESNPYDLGFSSRKLLGLASILAMQTPMIVLDEPTTGQDARGVERVAGIVADLAAAGRTIIAVTHDMRFAAEHFERIVVMRAGRIILDGAPNVVFAEESWPALASTYLEPPYAARFGARLGLGSTPTDASVVDALRASGAPFQAQRPEPET
jgi:energy-coupling factor transport system ATP-binding protein